MISYILINFYFINIFYFMLIKKTTKEPLKDQTGPLKVLTRKTSKRRCRILRIVPVIMNKHMEDLKADHNRTTEEQNKTIEDMLAENAALRKQIADLMDLVKKLTSEASQAKKDATTKKQAPRRQPRKLPRSQPQPPWRP